jgi:hypothetical protein
MQLAIPTEQYQEYAGLTTKQRTFVDEALHAFRIIAAASNIGKGARQAAYQTRWSAKRCADLYRTYRKNQCDWRAIVPGWTGGNSNLPIAFVDHWRDLCERNQRKCRPAHLALMASLARWRAGDQTAAIPGYRVPPRNQPGKNHPHGWSYQHLMRKAPKRHELIAARIGRTASAAKYGTKVLTTRVGLKLGQYYMFDDVWHDLDINVIGQSKAVRPIEIGCIDLLTGYRPQWLCKPILKDNDTGKKQTLAENETLFVTASLLHEQGYREDGTVLIMEGGTATMRGPLQTILAEVTNGKVIVEIGGTQGAPAIAGDYGGRAKGNPRFKAALESFHNLLHNRLAALPGAVGKDRDHLPERHYRQQLRNNHLLRALVNLADAGRLEAVQDLRLDLLEWHQFTSILNAVYNQIHVDHDHDLQGWQAAGHILKEFRLSQDQPYTALTDLDDEQATLMANFTRGREGLVRARKMSRQEAWNYGLAQGGMRKLSLAGVGALLKEGVGTTRRVNDEGCFRIQDKIYAPEPYEFLARAQGSALAGGHEIPLERRQEYTTAWNPLQPDQLHVWDANGRWLGVCPGRVRARRDDEESIQIAMGEQKKLEADMLAGVNFRGRHIGEQRKANTAANLNLLDPAAKNRLAKATESKKHLNRVTQDAAPIDSIMATDEDEDYEPAGYSIDDLMPSDDE